MGPRLLASGGRRKSMGPGIVDADQRRPKSGPVPGPGAATSDVYAAAAREPGSRPQHAAAITERGMDARLLGLATEWLCLAARVLGGRSDELDLDAPPLHLDSQR